MYFNDARYCVGSSGEDTDEAGKEMLEFDIWHFVVAAKPIFEDAAKRQERKRTCIVFLSGAHPIERSRFIAEPCKLPRLKLR